MKARARQVRGRHATKAANTDDPRGEMLEMAATLRRYEKRLREIDRAMRATPEHKASAGAFRSLDPHGKRHVPFNPDRVRRIWSIPYEIATNLGFVFEDLHEVIKWLELSGRATARTCREDDLLEHVTGLGPIPEGPGTYKQRKAAAVKRASKLPYEDAA